MTASIKLGRIWGIPIGLHWSLLLVFGLLVTSLASSYLPDQYPGLSDGSTLVIATVTGVLFFGSILLHELGHAFVALREKIPVNSITLFIFGGVAQIGAQSRTAGAEFRIAAGGPLVSFVIALVCGGLWLVSRDVPVLAAPTFWLARINLILLLFNLIPGYPLDGGRMLRAAVWHLSGSERHGLRVATISGQLVSFAMIGLGALWIFNGRVADGIWLIFIGWFLQNATAAEATASTAQNQLRGATAGQAMALVDEPQVPSRMKLRQVVDDYVLASGQGYFIVVDGELPRGVATLRDITKVPQDRWEWASVEEIMTPWSRLGEVKSTTDLLSAMRTMEELGMPQVPVVDNDRLVGLLTRDEILRYVRLRAELGS